MSQVDEVREPTECESSGFSNTARIEERKKGYREIASEGEQTYAFPDPFVGQICRLAVALAWKSRLWGFLEEYE